MECLYGQYIAGTRCRTHGKKPPPSGCNAKSPSWETSTIQRFFSAFGNIFNGILQEMRSGGVFLQFVKPEFSTADCGNADAVVILEVGGSLDPEEIEEIYRGYNAQPAGAFRGLLRACDWYRSHYDRHEHHLFQDGLAGEPRALGTRIAMRGARLTSSGRAAAGGRLGQRLRRQTR